MNDFGELVGMIFVIFVIPMALLIAGAMWLDSASCHATATKMEFESSWGVLQGCQIKTADGWIPMNMYRKFADKK